jgi:peptidoglycan/xylan/chitin deacetylase (PgdA/CDA1 family)
MEFKQLVAGIANHSGILDCYAFCRRTITRSQVVILEYHSVLPQSDEWYSGPCPDNFDLQMKYFSRNFEILSVEELVALIQNSKRLPVKAAVVTFDDGYKDNYLYAYPILKKYSIPATIFLATEHINTGKLFWWDTVKYMINHTSLTQISLPEIGVYSLRSLSSKRKSRSDIIDKLKLLSEEEKNKTIEKLEYMSGVDIPVQIGRKLVLSWENIKEMSRGGVSFGAHTVNHPILTKIPLIQARYEISQSKKDIEENLQKNVSTFSYPDGELNSELVNLVKNSGFSCAVSVLPCKLINRRDNVYALSRIGAVDDFSKLKVEFCGILGDCQRVIQRG